MGAFLSRGQGEKEKEVIFLDPPCKEHPASGVDL
jgi:hypothetical protein